MKSAWQLLFLMCTMLLWTGCRDDDSATDPDPEKSPSQQKPQEEDLGGPLPGKPEVEVWDWEQTLDAVHQHRGKVVVLHLWASWNETKDHWFQEFVRLKKLHRDDVAAISLNTDYTAGGPPPETYIDTVRDFAEKHGANFQHGVSSVPDELLQEQLEIFGMPAVLVFDKAGERRHTFFQDEGEEPFSYRQDVIPAVEQLIKEEYTPPAEQPAEDNEAEANPTDNGNADAGNGAESAEVSLQVADWEGLQKQVAAQKGRVVVVDLWSTSCLPCMKEFPNLVELHNEHKADVACLSFNLDYIGLEPVEEIKPRVLSFLKKQKATFPNFLSSEKDDAIYSKLDLASIPAVYIYDRAGKLRKRFDEEAGEFTYENDILPFVQTLIDEK